MSVFPRELYQAPRSWTELAYPKLIYFNELDRGNHFAAWQEPGLFADELREAFRSVRTAADWWRGRRPMPDDPGTPVRNPGSAEAAPPSRPGLIRSIAHRLAGERARPAGRGPPGLVRAARPAGSTPSR